MVNLKSKLEANADQTATLIYANQILLREGEKNWDSFTSFPCSKVASDKNCGHLWETCLANPRACVTSKVLQRWKRLQGWAVGPIAPAHSGHSADASWEYSGTPSLLKSQPHGASRPQSGPLPPPRHTLTGRACSTGNHQLFKKRALCVQSLYTVQQQCLLPHNDQA